MRMAKSIGCSVFIIFPFIIVVPSAAAINFLCLEALLFLRHQVDIEFTGKALPVVTGLSIYGIESNLRVSLCSDCL